MPTEYSELKYILYKKLCEFVHLSTYIVGISPNMIYLQNRMIKFCKRQRRENGNMYIDVLYNMLIPELCCNAKENLSIIFNILIK